MMKQRWGLDRNVLQLFLDWRSYGGTTSFRLLLRLTLILSTFRNALSWTLTAELERVIRTFSSKTMSRTRRFAAESRMQLECIMILWSPNHVEEPETLAWRRQFCREAVKGARRGRQKYRLEHQGMGGNGVWRFPEGSRRQGKRERYCCNVICAARTTVKVKGLR